MSHGAMVLLVNQIQSTSKWEFKFSEHSASRLRTLCEQVFFTVLRVEGALVVVSVDSGEFDLVAGLAYVAEVAEEDGVF